MFDLRGNRITSDGKQMSDNPLISEDQWKDFEKFMSNPNLRAVILCSETPFIGEQVSKIMYNIVISYKRQAAKKTCK